MEEDLGNGILQRMTNTLIFAMERFFLWLGRAIGRYPVQVILGSFLIAAASIAGVTKMDQGVGFWTIFAEDDVFNETQFKLMNEHFKRNDLDSLTLKDFGRFQSEPASSVVRKKRSIGAIDRDSNLRSESIIVVAKNNSLTRQHLLDILLIEEEITKRVHNNGRTYQDVCLPMSQLSSRAPPGNGSGHLEECAPMVSALSIFGRDRARLQQLTDDQILGILNTLYSPDVQPIFGRMRRSEEDGRILGTNTSIIVFWLKHRVQPIPFDSLNHVLRRVAAKEADFRAENFENAIETHLLDIKNKLQTVEDVAFLMAHGLIEGMQLPVLDDMYLVVVGYVCVFCYMCLVMGNLNFVQSQVWLSVAGLFSVLLGSLMGIGLTSVFGIKFTSINIMMLFVLLGIGVDDMFVISESFYRVYQRSLDEDKCRNMDASEFCGQALQEAGVLVTVTTASDIAAFAMGTRTSIVVLQSFCVYTLMSLFCIYLLQVTLFAACCVLDYQRIRHKYNSILCCYRHPDSWAPPSWSRKRVLDVFFEKILCTLLETTIFKVLVLGISAAALALSVYHASNISNGTKFDEYFASGADIMRFRGVYETNFDETAFGSTSVFIEDEDLYQKSATIHRIEDEVRDMDQAYSATCWYKAFEEWLAPDEDTTTKCRKRLLSERADEDAYFWLCLKYFIEKSYAGRPYRKMIDFSPSASKDRNGMEYHKIKVARVCTASFTFEYLVDVIAGVRDIAEEHKETLPSAFALTPKISTTMFNIMSTPASMPVDLSLTLLAVSAIVLVMTVSVGVTTLVTLCICMAVLELLGYLHVYHGAFDGFVTSNMTISIGLLVDYCLHVGHTFLHKHGTRSERVRQTMASIGPPVVHGATSTFLAFVPLLFANARQIIFLRKFYFGVVMTGLFNGLFVLPVLLSLVGPAPIPVVQDTRASAKEHTGRTTSKEIYINGGFHR